MTVGASATPFPLLVPNACYRDCSGVMWLCIRVTPCSATVVEQHAEPRLVVIRERDGDGTVIGERTFVVASGRRLEISPRSALERIES